MKLEHKYENVFINKVLDIFFIIYAKFEKVTTVHVNLYAYLMFKNC